MKSYRAGDIYLDKVEKARFSLVTWGDFNVSLTRLSNGKRIHISHKQLKENFDKE